MLSAMEMEYVKVPVVFASFEASPREFVREVPAMEVNGVLVTTVFDLYAAYLGVRRGDLGGDYPADYDDPKPFTPAWQEAITGASRDLAIKVAREFMETALYSVPVYGKKEEAPFFGDEETPCGGRSLIFVGPGINHWYHNDLVYRAVLQLVLLGGTQGKNGGGWAHYVGQEKIRTLIGWAQVAFALDWIRPPRHQNSPSYWYIHTDQWRYDPITTRIYAPPWARKWGDMHEMDANVIAVRLGWLPFHPHLNVNPIDLASRLVEEAKGLGRDPAEHAARRVAEMLRSGEVRLSVEDPDAPENWPRVLFVWRANILGSSSKGHEYFLKHLLGTDNAVMAEEVARGAVKEAEWRDPAPQGKLDLLVTLDFRMATTAIYSDVVLPAATWYEKYDLSMTDLHTFIHPFTPAIDPPWEAKSDWDIFRELARKFSELARRHLPEEAYDVVLKPLWHDNAEEIAQPFGEVKDWKKGEVDPIPGKTMARVALVKRRFWDVYDMFVSLGPLAYKKVAAKGVGYSPEEAYVWLRDYYGASDPTSRYVADQCAAVGGCPTLYRDYEAADAILALSPEANGEMAIKAFKSLEGKTGVPLADLGEKHANERIRFRDIVEQPRRSLTSPVWSGIEEEGRTYSPFTINTERLVPWRTLTGRQHFYIDHEWFRELGESLPTYKPPLDWASLGLLVDVDLAGFDYDPAKYRVTARTGERALVLRFLTPHGKWNIHSEYWDNLIMLTLFRGGQVVWVNDEDARWLGIRDNEWIELYNANGVIVARAALSPRIPRGTAIMYHAQERHVYVPISPKSGKRAGIHNSVTATHLKPTQMVGGYAQLSYFINYYGPTGVNRDTVVLMRRAPTVRL